MNWGVTVESRRIREVIPPPSSLRTFGTVGYGFDTARLTWSALRHCFHSGPTGYTSIAPGGEQPNYQLPSLNRVAQNVLTLHPVDLLIVDGAQANRHGATRWHNWVAHASVKHRPQVIVESWGEQDLFQEDFGPTAKAQFSMWTDLGYATRYRRMKAEQHNSAQIQTRIIVVRIRGEFATDTIHWTKESTLPPRPMSNMLTPFGIPGKAYAPFTLATNHIPDAMTDPMPNKIGSFIRTNKGVRRLQPDEVARGSGVPKEWIKPEVTLPTSMVHGTTSANIWEAVAASIRSLSRTGTTLSNMVDQTPVANTPVVTDDEEVQPFTPQEDAPWTWKPPDLSPGGAWYSKRVHNLRIASATLPDSELVYANGLKALEHHRTNYTETHPDPHHLQLLWWEFPPEHWEALRTGSSMNFLVEPKNSIQANGTMDKEQEQIGEDFVEELIALGVLEEVPTDDPLHCNAPLFCIPKAGQPGQWRVLANMRTGGQNETVGTDPVVLPRVNHLLEHLYAGGFSAVVDASKFFYQFETIERERKYLGLIHPVTGKHYRYKGLPMGAGNSPALAGRYGASFVRLLQQKRPDLFSGTITPNCWRAHYQEGTTYNPAHGFGMVWYDETGLPSVQVYVFVDDFLIHGPTYARTSAALTAFMDLTVDVGLLCHPGKLTPPAHVVKYVGFLIDTEGIPTLRIPTAKCDKALAMIDYFLDPPITWLFSGLAVAVISGVLESLVEATPNRAGRQHLSTLYSALGATSPEELPTDDTPALSLVHKRYYTKVVLPAGPRADLKWWRHILATGSCRSAYGLRAHVLTPTWGDGSGTGTGGTIEVDGLHLEQWMGAWETGILEHSSNWKELRTLALTLERLRENKEGRGRIRGSLVFYFTDNMVTYYIVHSGRSKSPALQTQIAYIKDLERELGIRLEPIHVPGKAMILQGTDGLSRGVWISDDHVHRPGPSVTAAVFEPVPPHPDLPSWAASLCDSPVKPSFERWDQHWDTTRILNGHTLWLPPPTVARQLLYFLLALWTECPTTTSMIILLPRVLQRDWNQVSRYVIEIGTYAPTVVPTYSLPLLPIP